MQTPYQLLGGEAGVRRLAEVFYDVMDELPQAQEVRAMHSAKLDEIKQKLFEYLSGWMGGPHHYAQKYGGVCLTKPHKPYAIGPVERDQWLLCMDEALRRVGASEEVQAMLKEPMFAIADAIRNTDGANCPSERDGEACADEGRAD
jgi:hemoglobin